MKTIKKVALVAILVPALFSCGKSDKQSNDGEKASTEATETTASTEAEGKAASTDLDVKRIMAYKEIKKPSQLSEKDYDFLLDQMEILMNKANELPDGQAKNFIKTLDKDQQEAAFVLGFILASSNKSTWTDKQKKKFQELEKRDPTKK